MGQTSLDIHPLCNLLGCFPLGMGMHYPQFSSIVANAFKEVYQSSPRCLPLQIFTYSTISLNFHNHVASSNFSLRKLSRFSSIDVIPQKQGPFFIHTCHSSKRSSSYFYPSMPHPQESSKKCYLGMGQKSIEGSLWIFHP